MLQQSEKTLKLVGDILAVLSTIAEAICLLFYLVMPMINDELEDANWGLLVISLTSYFLVLGFSFSFKVLSNISKKLNAEEVEEVEIKEAE